MTFYSLPPLTGEYVETLFRLAQDPNRSPAELRVLHESIWHSATDDTYTRRLAWAALWLTAVQNPAWDLWLLEPQGLFFSHQSALAKVYGALCEANLEQVYTGLLALPYPPSVLEQEPWRLSWLQKGWTARRIYLSQSPSCVDSWFFESILAGYFLTGAEGKTGAQKREQLFQALVMYTMGATIREGPEAEHVERAQAVLSLVRSARESQ